MANGMALRLMGRDADVDDLVQESFASALRSLDRLENPNAFASWFGAIVVRTACKVLRRRRLARRLGLRDADSIDVEALVSREAPPDVAAELRAIYAVVEDLPADVRVPLVLRRVEEHSLDEIARLMGTSLATVKRRIAAGERLLREILTLPGRTGGGPS
jgi:RNA polymerase sigma-70 factor (ECF subfamily)